MTGLVDLDKGSRATHDAWATYGIRYRVEKYGSVVQNWTFADPNDGCFIVNDGPAAYVIKVKPKSTGLRGGNTVVVKAPNSSVPTYAVTTPFIGASQTTYEVILPSKGVLRIFTVLAFSIERAFQGNYYVNELKAWKDSAPPCNSAPSTLFCNNNGVPHIRIEGGDSARKFVIAHEYGHANMYKGVGTRANDCGLVQVDDNPSNPATPPWAHRLQGREASSCAATEGFAHFVAGDVFNWHNNGTGSANPLAEVTFRTTEVWNLGEGNGQCPASYPLDGVGYPNDHSLGMYVNCSPGVLEPWEGTEQDWARLWWDYHEDTSLPGDTRTHLQLHYELINAGPWGAYDAYAVMRSGVGAGQQSRWEDAADWNGVCAGGSC